MHDRWGSTNRRPKRNRFANEGPFEIEIQGESTIAKYNRNKDVEQVQQFNAQIQAWGASVKAGLVESIGRMIKVDKELSGSLKNNYYADNKPHAGRLVEIDRIGFSFRPEGIYVHMGVGRGYHHNGSVSTKQNRMNADKQNTMGRKPVLWFNPVIEQHIGELSKIVENYADGLILNYSRIYISE
jgi:hypothetical protein